MACMELYAGENGKIIKIPFLAYGGVIGTDEKYKDTLATYDEAYAAMQSCGASGLGFKIPEDMYFLDNDHREMSASLLQKLLGTTLGSDPNVVNLSLKPAIYACFTGFSFNLKITYFYLTKTSKMRGRFATYRLRSVSFRGGTT